MALRESALLKARKMYIREIEKEIFVLEQLLSAFERQFDAAAAERIYRILHTMKGSAPIFGFTRTGKLAGDFLDLWSDEAELQTKVRRTAVVAVSRSMLMDLKVEYEINCKELELDKKENGSNANSGQSIRGHLLIIDDDQVLRSYLKESFELDGYRVDEAENLEIARRKLFSKSYDTILLDLMMYPNTGYELFHFLKEDHNLKRIPVIVLSGRDHVSDRVRCLRLGADDYVTKPFDYQELEARTHNLIAKAKYFEQIAFRDALTGVCNRRFLDHHLDQETQRLERYPQTMALAMIDIDHFKSVNDRYGHQIGDLVLQGMSRFLQANLRETDFISRYGGEEFCVVMPDTSDETAIQTIEKILEALRKEPVIQNEGIDYHITFSAGIAQWRKGIKGNEWIQLSDQALYQAKNQGRNRVIGACGEIAQAAVSEQSVLPRKRILVVDDDASIRALLSLSLKKLSVEIVEARDGVEALDYIRSNRADLCILDGVMPNMDGFELLQIIRNTPKLSSLKVVMLSALNGEKDIKKGLDLGADDFIPKPFSLVELELRIRHLLDL